MKQYPDFVDEYGEWSGYYGKYGVMNGPQFMDAAHHYATFRNCVEIWSIRNNRYAMMRLEEKILQTISRIFKMYGRWATKFAKISERFAEKSGGNAEKTEHDEDM
ncbi:MAG: hypothetical protein ACLSEY_14735 [Enterocloster sp.]